MSSPTLSEAFNEAARRESEVLARLKKALKDKHLVVIVGAGVTLGATADISGRPLPRLTWTGLIRNGLDYLVTERYVNPLKGRTRRAYDALEDADTGSLLDAANILKSELIQSGQFPTWLESVFGSLYQEVRHPSILKVLKALHEKGATLLTTNYDDVLEKFCGLPCIDQSNQGNILKFKRGDLDGVFHIHGSYHDPQEVVLDTTGYYKVMHSEEVQSILKNVLEFKTVLFVGCGSGLEDPNFHALLKWASERQENIPDRHCLLLQNGDNLNFRPLVRLRYGPGYQDLVPYLHKLLDDSYQPAEVAIKVPTRGSLDDNPDEIDHYLSKLHYAADAAFNSRSREHEPQCLTDTRVDLLRRLMAWSNNPHDKCIFWLNGMAGAGKSTIARTVARRFYDQGRLGASFFFSRGRGDLAKADKFFPTLAIQFAKVSIYLKRYICEAVAKQDDIGQQVLSDQWNQLILRPLSMLKDDQIPSSPLILVIDALDECENQNDIRMILRLLAEANDLKVLQLRVFVTSRPEIPILLGFGEISDMHQDFVLQNIPPSDVEHDIFVFIQHELKDIRTKRYLPAEWPGKQVVEILVQRAGFLFIFASTVCRFIGNSRFPEKRLDLVIEGAIPGQPQKPSQSPTSMLDDMYSKVLTHSVLDCDKDDMPELSKLFKKIVGCIVILNDALSVVALSELLSMGPERIMSILGPLRSVLDIPNDRSSPVRLLHPSFRDFLLDEQRCLNDQFKINEKEAQSALVENSLKVMSETLKRDVCGLKTPGALTSGLKNEIVEKNLLAHVQYACCYWVNHLQRGEIFLCNDNGKVHEFLQKHFLHWLEALSITGKISEGILMMATLQSMFAPDKRTELSILVHDARRFFLNHRRIIEIAPLQLYSSALLFSPTRSVIRRLFLDPHQNSIIAYPIIEDWGPSLQTLEGHSDWVHTLAFSPDGRILASGSDDGTVRLWDPTTGAVLQKLEGHSKSARTLTFSPDGRVLACGSGDGTVRLWDPTTGAALQKLEGHSRSVQTLTFSPDGQILVSGSGDGIVQLWDPTTGAALQKLQGHSGSVWTLAFSPNGRILASGSDGGIVQLWDPTMGTALQKLEGHSGSVRTLAFLPGSWVLASGSGDGTVRLWDLVTGMALQKLEGHARSVRTLAFSPDGRILASGSGDRTIQFWDPITGAALQKLEGHLSWVETLAFSPDGRVLASGSADRTVRLWDVEAMELIHPFNVENPQASSEFSVYSIDDTKRWVTWNNHNVLFLPFDRECVEFVGNDNTMAVGHSSGRLTFLKFKPGLNPLLNM